MGESLAAIRQHSTRWEIQKNDIALGTLVCREGSAAEGRDGYGRRKRPGIVPAENWICPHSMSWNCVDPVRCPTKD